MKYDLNIRLGGSAWNLYAERLQDPGFEKFSKKVFERDVYRCVFCGFSASTGMKVVNLDHNYANNKLSNLVTACPFCQQCLFLEVSGRLQVGGGLVIHLPEMSQAQLNAMCHVLYASIVNGSTHTRQADAYVQSLKLRASVIEKTYGKNTSNPAFLGQLLIDTPCADIEQRREKILPNIRLLPALDKFEEQITTWARNAIGSG